MQESIKRRREEYFHDLGKWLVDVSKLAFGSLVLGSVISWNISQIAIFAIGVIFSGAIAFIGIFISRLYKGD
ncbi:MAG: hypothetical protein FWH12_02535 [Treponema sp.]|nr:hypothetical protein [Treponema sp.]